jgi:methylsterol monooxygenase
MVLNSTLSALPTGLVLGGHDVGATALALLAPLAPLNPQPHFKHAWESMTDNYSEYHISTYGSLTVQVLFYFGTALPGFLFQFASFMKAYKVQPGKQHSLKDQWMCLRQVFMAKAFIYLPLIIGLFYAVQFLGLALPYKYDTMPAWYSMIPRMLFCLICEDTWHYWAHRALHHKKIYGIVHKMHHTFNVPFGMAAEYAHPIETIVLGVGFFIPLPFVCTHLYVFWCWLAVRMIQTTDVHSGFDFPWFTPLYLIPGYGGVRFHDFHHSYFNANYVRRMHAQHPA